MGIAKTDRHHAVAQRVIMDLHYTSGQMAQLRQVISAHLELWGLIEVTDTGMLVASELCSNVRHVSDPGYELTLSRAGSSVRVEVRDKSTVLPELPTRPPDLLEVGGRGLFLVAALADRAGVIPLADGKIVWAECSAVRVKESE